MGDEDAVIEREIDLPPAIVWAAFVDPDLLAGWLATASADDSGFSVVWPDRPGAGVERGVVLDYEENVHLRARMETRGTVDLTLEAHPGGLRGTWTALRLRCDPAEAESWRVSLARLDELLRGHPVDWDLLNRSAHLSKRNNIR